MDLANYLTQLNTYLTEKNSFRFLMLRLGFGLFIVVYLPESPLAKFDKTNKQILHETYILKLKL